MLFHDPQHTEDKTTGGAAVKKQVLVVDDDLNICREIKDALQDETTDVQYTLPAEKILPEYMRQPFCIVIYDSSCGALTLAGDCITLSFEGTSAERKTAEEKLVPERMTLTRTSARNIHYLTA